MARLTGAAADARPASQSGASRGPGTPGDYVLYITEDGSPLYGLAGDDQLLSHRPGTEPPDESRTLEFFGGDGNDLISGFGGIRIVADGGAGNDDIDVRAESVDVFAGAGNDRVKVGSDGAVVYGGDGNDLLDVISFPEDPGFVDGGAGNDTILAGARLSGGGSRVIARGGVGDDTISVHPASSTGSPYHGIDANGGAGRDLLTGRTMPSSAPTCSTAGRATTASRAAAATTSSAATGAWTR